MQNNYRETELKITVTGSNLASVMNSPDDFRKVAISLPQPY